MKLLFLIPGTTHKAKPEYLEVYMKKNNLQNQMLNAIHYKTNIADKCIQYHNVQNTSSLKHF